MTARDNFLTNVRKAVAAGNQAGLVRGLPTGPRVGYQGGGSNLVQRFADELRAAGGQCHVVADDEHGAVAAVQIAVRAGAKKVILSGELASQLQLRPALRARGIETALEKDISAIAAKDTCFAADLGITDVDWLIAETGSIVLSARTGQARSPSLLPPVHIALAQKGQIVPDLFDVFDKHGAPGRPAGLPSCLTIITGPSKTGDIELKLVTGVHGPGEVHVVLIDS